MSETKAIGLKKLDSTYYPQGTLRPWGMCPFYLGDTS